MRVEVTLHHLLPDDAVSVHFENFEIRSALRIYAADGAQAAVFLEFRQSWLRSQWFPDSTIDCMGRRSQVAREGPAGWRDVFRDRGGPQRTAMKSTKVRPLYKLRLLHCGEVGCEFLKGEDLRFANEVAVGIKKHP